MERVALEKGFAKTMRIYFPDSLYLMMLSHTDVICWAFTEA
jgi:hypothetical protein